MTSPSHIQFKEIKFVSPDDPEDYCNLEMIVSYDNLNSIKIELTYLFSNDAPLREFPKSHPLYEHPHFAAKYSNYMVIHKNKLTSELVEFLLYDNKELIKYIGPTTPMQYRKKILIMLAMLCEF